MNPDLFAPLFVLVPLALGILMLLVIWNRRGRMF